MDLLFGFIAPDRFYNGAGSAITAAAIGGVYGLIGRVIYPKAGISPLNYAIWFLLAYQIKLAINLLETRFDDFIGVGAYLEALERVPEDQLDLKDQFRYHCWKVIQLKQKCVKVADQIFSRIFHIRPYQEVTPENVQNASFLEMCRYRIWPVFKSTILNTLSFSLAYKLSNKMGFTLPARTSASLLYVIQSIIKDIILVPALYIYVAFCNRLADNLGEGGEVAEAYRSYWIRRFLPVL